MNRRDLLIFMIGNLTVFSFEHAVERQFGHAALDVGMVVLGLYLVICRPFGAFANSGKVKP